MAINSSDSAPVREEETKKKEERRIERGYITIHVFLLFLHASKILILIKNNLKNTKNILTVRFNSV